MQENTSAKTHRILLLDRKQGNISGVLDVVSFDENIVILKTEQGDLQVKGKGLHVTRVDLGKGEVDLEGFVETMDYSKKRLGWFS